VLEDEGVGTWDWIVHTLAPEGDPSIKKRIRETCTPFEIARSFAMKIYNSSAEPRDS
jgi:hypothetical protein